MRPFWARNSWSPPSSWSATHYWSMDFHIPRRYGFRQVYGENGGPGGMFHFLRNLPPLLNIARRMEALCPEAWLINYTNPEAKLVEAVLKLTKIRAVGVCHGFEMGVEQIAKILDRPGHALADRRAWAEPLLDL